MKFGPEQYPALVFDANDHEINWVISGDTVTGLCVLLVRDSTGATYIGPDNEAVHAKAKFKAPLRLESLDANDERRK